MKKLCRLRQLLQNTIHSTTVTDIISRRHGRRRTIPLSWQSCRAILSRGASLPFLRREKALIHFTGYLAEGTLGRRLYDSQKDSIVDVSGLQVKKLADVKFTSEFSAHAKADELIQFLKDFEDIKLLLVNHGDDKKKDIYAERVINEIDPKNVAILGRDYFFRLDGYGFIKSLSTKL